MNVAVIGTGVSGLTALKWLKRAGLNATGFEQRQAIGGVWNLKQQVDDYDSPAYPGLSMNTSRRITGFSDAPYVPAPDYYPRREQVHDYLSQYARENHLLDTIKFNAHVTSITQEAPSNWQICGTQNDRPFQHRFDRVVICSGRHQYPSFPKAPHRDAFTGTVRHSVSYDGPQPYRDQRVLLVGCGASAADIAHQLSRVCRKVVVSAKSGRWIIPRLIKGKPLDYALTRFHQALPFSVRMRAMRRAILQEMATLGIRPDDPTLGLPHPSFDMRAIRLTLNTDFLLALQAGAISIKPEIKGFDGRTVVFTDDSCETIDTILYATGYRLDFPFLSTSLSVTSGAALDLYRYVFSPTHLDLAFVGMVNVQGPFPPVFELQSRWVASIFAGKQALPSTEEMLSEIRARQARRRHTGSRPDLVQYIPYMEDIAAQMGVRPRWWRHPAKIKSLWFDPVQAWHYRLDGPDAF